MRTTLSVVSLLVVLLLPCALLSAATNPKAVIDTNRGTITVELWPTVAPKTVENFIGLATGAKSFTDPATQQQVKRPFYDGLTFHRVINNFMIQGGCPKGNGSGGPGYKFADEISAKALGLDKEMMLLGDKLHPKCNYMMGQLRQSVIMPRMQSLGVTQTSSKEDQQAAFAKVKKEMEAMTLADFYEALGYVYQANLPSKQPVKGALCMANAGPNTNGSQFFINLVDTPHLAGKHTVFGAVVKGMDVVEAIGKTPVNGQTPQEPVVIKKIAILVE